MKKQAGIAVGEVLTLMIIFAIFMGIAYTTYQNYTRHTHYQTIVKTITAYKKGVETCYEKHHSLRHCNLGTRYIPRARLAYKKNKLIHTLRVRHGVISVIPSTKYGITSHDTYTLTPTIYKGVVTWKEGGKGVERGYAS